MKKTIASSIALLVLITKICGQQLQQIILTNPPAISGLTYKEADAAIFEEANSVGIEAKKIGPEYLANLVVHIRDGKLTGEKKVLLIWLLGELHPTDTNSMQVLIEYIDLKATVLDPKTRMRRWNDYPAEEALVKIGIPTEIPILDNLPNEIKPLRQHLLCEVLIQVEAKRSGHFDKTKGKALTRDLIKQKMEGQTNPEKQANLESALNTIE
jgi:hypothetical protein